MNNIQLYTDFLEGRLDANTEQQFAEEFLYSESFRKGFRNCIAVTRAINTNISKFGPPASVTAAVFTSAGFNNFAAAQSPLSSTAAKAPILGSNKLTALISSVLSVGITVAIMYFVFIDGNSRITPQSLAAAGNLSALAGILPDSLTNDQQIYQTSAAGINDEAEQYLQHNQKNKTIWAQNNKLAAGSEEWPRANTTNENNQVANVDNSSESIEFAVPVISAPLPAFSIPTANPGYTGLKNYLIKGLDYNAGMQGSFEWLEGIRIEAKKTAGRSFNKETVNPNDLSILNNAGLSIFCELTDNLSIGLDMRQEDFFLIYNGADSLENPIRIEQNASLALFGIIARYYPDIEVLGFKPSVQLLAGGGEYGFTIRAGAGMHYNLFSDFGILMQAEYTHLFFMHDKKYSNQGKIGINYGIYYKF